MSYSHEWNPKSIFFGPIPWCPGEGSKDQISFNFNYKVNFKDFYTKTVCVFSQMKDTKHIRRDFYSVAWVMPQGWDLGALGCPGGQKIFFSNMVMWHIKLTGMTSRTECKQHFHHRVKLMTLHLHQRRFRRIYLSTNPSPHDPQNLLLAQTNRPMKTPGRIFSIIPSCQSD